jgi:hypothetical protein
MVSCQKPSPLKGSKHSLQHHPHDSALVNAHSFVSMGVEAMCCPCHSAAHCRHMKRQPSLCHCCPCHGRCHCDCCCCLRCRHQLCHNRRPRCPLPSPSPSPSAIAVAVSIDHCRCRLCYVTVSHAIAVALTVGHCHPSHRWPLQLPSLLAITVIVAVGHF